MNRLDYLNLTDNRLTTLPQAIGEMTALRELRLYNNRLATLPDTIGRLSRLRELHLMNNQLTALPGAIGELNQLRHLDLRNNPCESCPRRSGAGSPRPPRPARQPPARTARQPRRPAPAGKTRPAMDQAGAAPRLDHDTSPSRVCGAAVTRPRRSDVLPRRRPERFGIRLSATDATGLPAPWRLGTRRPVTLQPQSDP
ncbi:leucine-rich repeat domain-containing protein [Streptosporangium lutulentum]